MKPLFQKITFYLLLKHLLCKTWLKNIFKYFIIFIYRIYLRYIKIIKYLNIFFNDVLHKRCFNNK